MGIAKYNREGYFDPTAYEAVRNIEAEQKKWDLWCMCVLHMQGT